MYTEVDFSAKHGLLFLVVLSAMVGCEASKPAAPKDESSNRPLTANRPPETPAPPLHPTRGKPGAASQPTNISVVGSSAGDGSRNALKAPNRFGGVSQIGIGDGPSEGEAAIKLRAEVTLATPVVMGALASEEVQRILNRAKPQFRHCYARGLRKKPALAGNMTLRLVINGQGRVANVKPKDNTLGDQATTNCVKRVPLHLRFPKPKGGGIVVVSLPLGFTQTPS